jgi:glycosyltransferase involved in cell wall biosynthesis
LTDVRLTALMPIKEHHGGYLRKALDSLHGQTSPHWRLLTIVEGDDYRDMERTLERDLRDPRIELVVNEGRKLSGAFNTGMRRAETDFVAILFGDDMWAPQAVEVLTNAIRTHPEADFLHSSRMIIDEHDRPLSSVHRSREEVTLEDFLRSAPVKHLLCWRRDKALSFGGMDETLDSVGPDDFDFPWTMAEHGAVFRAIPECLYLYRDHRECFRLTTHLPLSTHTAGLRQILRKHGVGSLEAKRRVTRARRTYMRQCLYRSRLDRWLKERLRFDPRRGWRDTYD